MRSGAVVAPGSSALTATTTARHSAQPSRWSMMAARSAAALAPPANASMRSSEGQSVGGDADTAITG